MHRTAKRNLAAAIVIVLLLVMTGVGIDAIFRGATECTGAKSPPTLPQLIVLFGVVNLAMVITVFVVNNSITDKTHKAPPFLKWMGLLWIILLIAWYAAFLLQMPSSPKELKECFDSDPAFYAVTLIALVSPGIVRLLVIW